jgi:hypothetical protein
VSLRALTYDPILPPGLSIKGHATRTHRSGRIAGICCTVPIKNTNPIHIDLTEDGYESQTIARREPLIRGGTTLGVVRKGPKTKGGTSISTRSRDFMAAGCGVVRGGAAKDGTAKGGAARGGETASVASRGGANASLSSKKVKGKRTVTTIQKEIEIMEAKRKRKELDWKP